MSLPPTLGTHQPDKDTWRYAGSIAELLTKVVLLGAPILYVLGRVHAEGYWTALGVAPSVMAVDAEDYIYLGFMVIASGLVMLMPRADTSFVWMAPLISLALIAALAACLWALGRIRRWLGNRLRQIGRQWRPFFAQRKPAFEAVETSASILNAASSLLLAFLLLAAALLFPIVLANSVGKWHAGKLRESLVAGAKTLPPVEVEGGRSGKLLECTPTFCVIFEEMAFVPVPLTVVKWTGAAHQAKRSATLPPGQANQAAVTRHTNVPRGERPTPEPPAER